MKVAIIINKIRFRTATPIVVRFQCYAY